MGIHENKAGKHKKEIDSMATVYNIGDSLQEPHAKDFAGALLGMEKHHPDRGNTPDPGHAWDASRFVH
jgi:hypothetical protein